MNGNTPLQKLRGYKTMIHPHVFTFPVLLMEDVITMLGTAIRWFETYFKINLVRITGTYVRARCQWNIYIETNAVILGESILMHKV
jgi:hypothetical protein